MSCCALLSGAAECRCPGDAPGLTDAQIEARARGMFIWQQKATPGGRAAARRGLDGLLAYARSRGPYSLVLELLRIGVMLRVREGNPVDAPAVETLLAGFTELAEREGDPVRLAEVAILRAHKVATYGHGESALYDAATALTILADVTVAPAGQDPRRWGQVLGRALNELLLVLLKLGAYEAADEVSQRAIAVAGTVSEPVERLVHQLNRARLQLSWALRLERAGRNAPAASRFLAASQISDVAAELWTVARTHPGGRGLPPAAASAVIGAAHALQRPGPEHLPLLALLTETAFVIEDRIMLAIATARCLLTTNRTSDAAAALHPLRTELLRGAAAPEPVLALAQHREFARVEDPADDLSDTALGLYAAALEDEMWALREARLIALHSHSEQYRLTREHGAVTAQALQDPLTGLPNRRALDLRLAEATGSPMSQPCSVALIDLDRFKDVNDARSHAAGDSVLRAVASCLRTTLRSHDLVARYGGDEFVVVMPSTPLPVAGAALLRAAEAVAELPEDLAAGVTMSVGVVRAPLGGEPTAALADADAAMYRAKRRGGNTVVIGSPTEEPPIVPVPGRWAMSAVGARNGGPLETAR